MFASATATAVFTSCCIVKTGAMARTRPVASSRIGPAIAQQNAQALGQGKAARRPQARDALARDLGDGSRPRSAGERT